MIINFLRNESVTLRGFALLVIAVSAAFAPSAVTQENPRPARNSPAPKKPFAFAVGEELKYEIRYSRFPLYARVGDLTLSVEEAELETEKGPELLKFKGEAVSRGLLVSLFGIKVHDTFESYADANDLGAYATVKRLIEGKRQHEQSVSFLREDKQLWYTDKDLGNPNSPASVTKAKTEKWVSDLMSIIYYTRTLEMTEGVETEVLFSDSGRTYTIPVSVFSREPIKIDLGAFKSIRLKPDIFFGKLFSKGGSMDVWLSDDPYKIPLKFVMKTSYGTISGELTSKKLMPLPAANPSSKESIPG